MALQHNVVLADYIIGIGQGSPTRIQDKMKLAGTDMNTWQYLKDIFGRSHETSV